MKPKISIIITCFNLGPYLKDCVNSIYNQTLSGIEIILVNDGSTDRETIEIINRIILDKKIIYINQNNYGVCTAKNNGAKKATADFMLFLDADDMIAPTYLEKAYNAFSENSQLHLVYCDVKEIGEGFKTRILPEFTLNNLLLYNAAHPSFVLRKEIWDNSKKFREEFKKGWEDWDFWLRIANKDYTAYKIPEPLYYYRIRKNSRDHLANQKYNSELEELIFKENLDIYLYNFPNIISILRNYQLLSEQNLSYEKHKSQIVNSLTYRIGNMILFPFKLIHKLFKK